MRNRRMTKVAVLATSLLISIFTINATECTVGKAAVMPVAEKHGSAGAFIGKVGDIVLIAGGSDFENAKPWEGGVKSYFDKVWAVTDAGGRLSCREVEDVRLPVPLGNGCAAGDGKTMFCIGGMNADGRSEDIFTLSGSLDDLKVRSFCSLPAGFVPNAAEYHKGYIYIIGSRDGANSLLRLNVGSRQFKELAPCPGTLVTEGSCFVYQHNGREEAFYLIGGRSSGPDGIFMESNVWEYLPTHDTWNRKASFNDGGKPLSLMYGSAVKYGSAHILVFGGDDGVEFLRRDSLGRDESRPEELVEAFLGHKGFSNKIFAYHTITDTWTTLDSLDLSLPVVTTAVELNGKIIIPSGEARPGVRSEDIIEVSIADKASFGWVNYLVVIVYLLLMMGMGFYFSRRNNGSDKFFKGGGSIPWWAAGISIFATALSAITFLSIPAKAYAADWGMFMYNMTIILTVPVVINFYLPLFRKLKVASAYEYLEERFSGSVRWLASAFFCLFMFTRIAIVLFLPSLALNAVTGINIYLCILMMGVVTIIYCTMGGIEAVVWGDVVQGILLVGGAIISFVWIVGGIKGGFDGFMNVAVEQSKFNILNMSLDWTQPVFWVAILGGFSNQLLTYTSDQSVVQKYLTVKDTKGTEKGLWLNGLLSIPIAFLFFGIGTALFVFFRQEPQLLNVGMSNTDSIFPHYIMCRLPVGISGLLIAAIFAAAMSTLSSNINSSTTVMCEDFYTKIRKNCTDAQKVRFARVSGIIVGTLGVLMAIALATFDIASLWDQFNFFLGLLTSSLGGLFLMGIFTKRIGTRSAVTGFVGCVVVLLLFHRFSHVTSTLYGFLGLVSCFLIGWLSSFVFGKGR